MGDVTEFLEWDWELLANCYIVADKLCLEGFQNKVMDVVIRACENGPAHASAIIALSRAGLRTCLMRGMLLKEMANEIRHEKKSDTALTLQSDFEFGTNAQRVLDSGGENVEDLLRALIQFNAPKANNYASSTKSCEWHVHQTTEKCDKKSA